MLCDVCGEKEASFHYTETINGETSEHHLCAACAANTDISYYTNMFDSDNPFMQLLSGIFGSVAGLNEEEPADPTMQVQCPNCQMSFGEFIKNSRFGCATCYDVFGVLLPEKIKKIQGSDHHVGKKPLAYREDKHISSDEEVLAADELDGLEISKETSDGKHLIEVYSRKMKEAVEQENYEEAARLRDLIAELRKESSDA